MSESIVSKRMIVDFIDGKPNGIRICRITNESLVTVVVPRDNLAEARQLPDIPTRGVYYLLDEHYGALRRVYVGQTKNGLDRLSAHKSKKEFWNTAVAFLDTEYNIDRDVMDALEAKGINYITSHGSYEADNEIVPTPSITPYRQQAVEQLHKDILFRMSALGYDLDRTAGTPCPEPRTLFHTKRAGITATGHYESEKGIFYVHAGSEVALDRKIPGNKDASDLRASLFGTQETRTTLATDQAFRSPSAAAVFVLGGSQNGWTEWVNSQGETLSNVYRDHKE